LLDIMSCNNSHSARLGARHFLIMNWYFIETFTDYSSNIADQIGDILDEMFRPSYVHTSKFTNYQIAFYIIKSQVTYMQNRIRDYGGHFSGLLMKTMKSEVGKLFHEYNESRQTPPYKV